MRVLVIGGSGHIGTYLTPRLVEAGHSVVNVSRAQRTPYTAHPAWSEIEQVTADRNTEEQAGSFGRLILGAKPDAVIDLTCYTLESAQHLAEALRGYISQFLHCGTIWVHGVSREVPTTEDAKREPFGDYGIRKEAIERYLLTAARRDGFPVTILHPGHLVGRGWVPLNPVGNFNASVFVDLARGREIALPNLGRECVHHVHADDVAQAFIKALAHWSVAVGESFHVVSPAALTLYGYAHAVAYWFGVEAKLRFVPWEEWKLSATEKEAQVTWGHIARSSNCSIEKARRLLGYEPRYSSSEAIHEAVTALIANKVIEI
ncbi:MAG: NAD-dependent epimerase/dehydratase family protein [Bryobacteraceae bacterium]